MTPKSNGWHVGFLLLGVTVIATGLETGQLLNYFPVLLPGAEWWHIGVGVVSAIMVMIGMALEEAADRRTR